MSEVITIQSAPVKYQPYLKAADEKGNKNGKIDRDSEADRAVVNCKEKRGKEKCDDFLDYLENFNYGFLRLNEKLKMDFDKIAAETGYKEQALSLLFVLKKKGLITKFGMAQIKNLLDSLASSAKEWTPDVYRALEGLVGKGLFEKIGAANLIAIAQAAQKYTGSVYKSVEKFEQEGLMKKYGLKQTIKLFMEISAIFAPWSDRDPYHSSGDYVINSLANKQFIEKIGMANLIAISHAAQEYSSSAFNGLERLIKEGFIEKVDFSDLIAIAKTRRDHSSKGYYKRIDINGTAEAYLALGQFGEKGYIKKYSRATTRSLFFAISKAAEESAYHAFTVLASFVERGLIEKHGINPIKELFVAIGDNADEYAGRSYSSLDDLDNELIGMIGIADLTAIVKAAKKGAGRAFDALKAFKAKGLFAKYSVSQVVNVFKETGEKVDSPNGIKHVDAFGRFASFAENGIIDKYGLFPLKNFVIGVSNAREAADTFEIFFAFEELEKQGWVTEYGIEQLKNLLGSTNFALAFGGSALSGDDKLEFRKYLDDGELDNVVKKVGFSNFVTIAKAVRDGYKAYLNLVRLNKRGLIDRFGVNNLVAIAKRAGPYAYVAYDALEKYAGSKRLGKSAVLKRVLGEAIKAKVRVQTK